MSLWQYMKTLWLIGCRSYRGVWCRHRGVCTWSCHLTSRCYCRPVDCCKFFWFFLRCNVWLSYASPAYVAVTDSGSLFTNACSHSSSFSLPYTCNQQRAFLKPTQTGSCTLFCLTAASPQLTFWCSMWSDMTSADITAQRREDWLSASVVSALL